MVNDFIEPAAVVVVAVAAAAFLLEPNTMPIKGLQNRPTGATLLHDGAIIVMPAVP